MRHPKNIKRGTYLGQKCAGYFALAEGFACERVWLISALLEALFDFLEIGSCGQDVQPVGERYGILHLVHST